MAVKMNVAEAKARLSELIKRAEAGEEVIIARDGVPAVVMKAANEADKPKVRRLGLLEHLGPVWEAPDAWAPDEEAADFLEQSWEEDFADDKADGAKEDAGS